MGKEEEKVRPSQKQVKSVSVPRTGVWFSGGLAPLFYRNIRGKEQVVISSVRPIGHWSVLTEKDHPRISRKQKKPLWQIPNENHGWTSADDCNLASQNQEEQDEKKLGIKIFFFLDCITVFISNVFNVYFSIRLQFYPGVSS